MGSMANRKKNQIEPKEAGLLSRFGPGLITGASDDDPSGIGTYSQAGAQIGFGIGWTMLLSYPLMVAIQEISARIGRVTGHGIAGNVCRNFPSPAIWSLILLLFVANTINIAADLGAMADASRLLVGGPAFIYVVVFALISVLSQIFFNYKLYVAILKWLTLTLFAYVIALGVVHVPWAEALRGLVIPKISFNAQFLTTLVAILGTTISPYLFIWQSSQEAEEQRIDKQKSTLKKDPTGYEKEFWRIRLDTLVGMAFSNLIAIAIIITTAATLHVKGVTCSACWITCCSAWIGPLTLPEKRTLRFRFAAISALQACSLLERVPSSTAFLRPFWCFIFYWSQAKSFFDALSRSFPVLATSGKPSTFLNRSKRTYPPIC
jgi:NRAMP (natural resistance-associated macrophage protein)-like metal ion transporter